MDENIKNEQLSIDLISILMADGIVKKCPSGCLVEKISGCNYIECKCGVKFCWNCEKLKGDLPLCPWGNQICNSH